MDLVLVDGRVYGRVEHHGRRRWGWRVALTGYRGAATVVAVVVVGRGGGATATPVAAASGVAGLVAMRGRLQRRHGAAATLNRRLRTGTLQTPRVVHVV